MVKTSGVLVTTILFLDRAASFSFAPCKTNGSTSSRFGHDQPTRLGQRRNSAVPLFLAHGPTDELSFDEMSDIVKRLDKIESSAPDILGGFYEPHLLSFSVKPGSVERLSITSTCYALLAIENSKIVYDKMVTNGSSHEGVLNIANVVKAMLGSTWRDDDLFQVPLLLYTILRVDNNERKIIQEACSNEETASKMSQLVRSVLDARPKRRLGERQVYSDYILHQVCQVLAALQENSPQSKTPGLPVKKGDEYTDNMRARTLPDTALPEGATGDIAIGLARCAEVSSNELCRQLAYHSAGDTASFDIMRLAYSLLTYVQSTQSLSGVAGRELVPGKGPTPGTQVVPLKKQLVIAALKVFFAEQNKKDGLWDKGQPIYKSFRRQGRNVGNAFIFSVDTVGCLLRILPPDNFRPHLVSLERTLSWIENHQTMEIIPDYCDPESGECYGKPLRGWSSPHLQNEFGPQAWSTAQVLACTGMLKQTIRKLMHKDVLEEFGGTQYSENGIQPASWDRLLDTDLGPTVQHRTIKSVLEERVITPFSSSIDEPSFGAAYSAILHGPPGTAKTTICEALAQKMGFDFLVVDTTAFLADGLTNVASRIRYVFSRLMALRECVILFDEIEEFALNRETPGLSMESRMLTTSMLTAINDLRRGKQSVFFVATNRLRAFDSAITRPGRFDMQLFVGTPNLEARIIQFQNALPSFVSVEKREQATAKYSEFLEQRWAADGMFMNYLEGLQFASACADLVVKNPEQFLDEGSMESVFDQQVAVITVRGAVRDEYLASMKMSRV